MQPLFAARFKAGQRGANAIEMVDLLFGIVLEDQGKMEELLLNTHGAQDSIRGLHSPSHKPFLPSAAAGDILTGIENLLPRSEPYAHTIEIPLSPNIERIFDGADDVRNMFHHNKIEPLHLLAAALSQESSQPTNLLREAGITREMVIARLRATEG